MNYFDKILSPVLVGDLVTLSDITILDKEEYFNIYTDDQLNKYWGYDYREDLTGEVNSDDFYNFQLNLKKTKEEYSLAIRLNGKMIGDVVMHNFTNNSIEIGFRLDKNYHGNGYAFDAVKTLITYIFNEIKPDFITAKCYIQNTPSMKLLNKLGFNKIGSDETYYYFNLPLNK